MIVTPPDTAVQHDPSDAKCRRLLPAAREITPSRHSHRREDCQSIASSTVTEGMVRQLG